MLKWLYLGCIESNKIYYFILTVSFYLLNVAPGTRVTVYTAHICTSHIAIRPCCSKPCHCPKRTTFITSLSSMIPPDHHLSSFQLTTTSALTQLSNPLRSVSHWLVSPCFNCLSSTSCPHSRSSPAGTPWSIIATLSRISSARSPLSRISLYSPEKTSNLVNYNGRPAPVTLKEAEGKFAHMATGRTSNATYWTQVLP